MMYFYENLEKSGMKLNPKNKNIVVDLFKSYGFKSIKSNNSKIFSNLIEEHLTVYNYSKFSNLSIVSCKTHFYKNILTSR